MSEYQEALSRLNIPERTPGMTISRSLFPITRKDTPYNMDRILRETLNTPLPKYSIPQRLIFSPDGSYGNKIPLDKQFTLAKGGRKAIAIRGTHLTPAPMDINHEERWVMYLSGEFDVWVDAGDFDHYTLKDMPLSFTFYSFDTRKDYIEGITKAITDTINNYFKTEYGKELNIQIPEEPLGLYQIKFSIEEDVELDFLDPLTIKIQPLNFNMVNLPRDKGTEIAMYDVEEDLGTYVYQYYYSPGEGFFNGINLVNVCSTINPWSPSNIICSLKDNFPVLNKLFPYDNQQEIKIWFTDLYGNKLPCLFEGYIDLELIIDNLNNFAMED